MSVNVKDVLKLAFVFIQKEELLDYSIFDGTTLTITNDDQEEINRLIRCLNLVVSEIASDYIPLKHTEEITIDSTNRYNYSNLEKTMLDMISLVDEGGKKHKFKERPEYFEALEGKYAITYSYIPATLTIDSNLESFYQKITARIFAYGVAMEYCFVSSLYEDALIWEKRYKDALLSASRKKSEISVKKRGWF